MAWRSWPFFLAVSKIPSEVLIAGLFEAQLRWTQRPFATLDYSLKTTGGPLTRFPLKSTVTSTRSAILINGMPLFIP